MGAITDALAKLELTITAALDGFSTPPVKVLGYGEISVIIKLEIEGKQYACKRLPPFRDRKEFEQYSHAYEEYRKLLTKELDIHIAEGKLYPQQREGARLIVYEVQPLIEAERLCHKALKNMKTEDIRKIFDHIFKKVKELARINRYSGDLKIGLDAQLSNWYLPPKEGSFDVGYFDLNTPMVRKRGREILPLNVFLASIPPVLRAIVKRFMLSSILDNYYNPRGIVLDLIANLIKEERTDLIDPLIDMANRAMAEDEILRSEKPLTKNEVTWYYRFDALTWIFLLALRKFQRLVMNRILKKPYGFLLPDKVKRW